MATITSQGDFDALYANTGRSLIINDQADAGGLRITANNVNVTARPGSVIRCQNFGYTAGDNSSWTLDRCTLLIEDNGGQRTGQVRFGTTAITDCYVSFSNIGNDAARLQWPCWGGSEARSPNPTLNMSGSYITAAADGFDHDGDGGGRTANQSLIFSTNALAFTGNNFSDVIFGENVCIVTSPAQIPWVRVTMSGGRVPTVVGSTGHFRIDNAGRTSGAGSAFRVNDARWEGFFGCDFSTWDAANTGTNQDILVLANADRWQPGGSNATATNRARIYLVDNVYGKNEMGFRVPRTGTAHCNAIFGHSWYPQFRDLETGVAVTDAVVDFLTTTVHLTQQGSTRAALLTEQGPTASHNYVELDDMFFGAVMQVGNQTYINGGAVGNYPLTVNGARPTSLPYWSYALNSFTAGGTPSTIDPSEAGTWVDAGQLDVADRQTYDVEADPHLNGRSKTQAEGLATNGITNALDVYPAFKSLAIDTRQDTNFVHDITNGGYDAGSRSIVFTDGGDMDGDNATIFTIKVTGTVTGRFTSGNQIAMEMGETATIGAHLDAAGTIDLEGITLADGAVIDGDDVSNFPDASTASFTIPNGSELNFNEATGTTIDFATAFPNATFGTGITFNNAGAGTVTIVNGPAGAVAGTRVQLTSALRFTGGAGAAGTVSHLQVFALPDATATEADNDTDDALTGMGGGATYPLFAPGTTFPEIVTGERYVVVWTRPGYNEFRQIIGPIATGTTEVEIVQTRNILANINTADNPNYGIDALYDETNNRVDYFINQGTSPNANGPGTNYLFEQAKATSGIGEWIAKNPENDVELVSHTGLTATSLRTGTYQLRAGAGAPLLQQSIAFTAEEDPAGGPTDGQAVAVIASTNVFDSTGAALDPPAIAQVLVGAEVQGVTYGEVDGIVTSNRTLQNTELRNVVDEELDRGTLTNIGR